MPSPVADMPSVADTLNPRFRFAVDMLGLDPKFAAILDTPEREICCSIPIIMDSGEIEVFWGCRIQHSTQRGPAKGGIVFSPVANQDEVRAMAASLTLQHALIDVPFGGAKGAIRCDPSSLSNAELERIIRRYTTRIMDIIGPDRDVPSRDKDCTPQMMAWIYDTYSMHTLQWHVGVVTGKPLEMGGCSGCMEDASHGMHVCAREACSLRNIDYNGARLAIDGFGNMGQNFAAEAGGTGAKVVAVRQGDCAVLNKDGLDITALAQYSNKENTIRGFPAGEEIGVAEFFAEAVDLLALCEIQNTIGSKTAGQIKAAIVLEGAGGATTPAADEVFDNNGVFVVPEILCSAGRIAGSYFEWVQNRQGLSWEKQEVLDSIEEQLSRAFRRVLEYREKYKTILRTAAYILAVDEVAEVTKMRGVYA